MLVGNDPKLIEVKSSRKKDQRLARQLKNLKTLQEFFETDMSHGLRGYSTVYRVAMQSVPNSFEVELNECINDSYVQGFSLKSPEPGVCYVAITGDVRVEDVFGQVQLAEPLLFSLNEAKINRDWSPYYPFTLLIQSEHALYDFMLGRLFVMVFLDIAVMKDLVRTMGWIPNIDMESDYPLRICGEGGEERASISRHLLARAAMEALSLKWIVEEGFREPKAGFLQNV